MKVLLRTDVEGVGRRGDIVDVKNGFARNYLLPSGAGLLATDAMAQQASAMRRKRDLKDAHDRAAAETQKAALERAPLTIEARAAANGRLFGSVTEADIAKALSAASGVSVDRHQVDMAEHLKELGATTVVVRLFGDVTATVPVEVTAKG